MSEQEEKIASAIRSAGSSISSAIFLVGFLLYIGLIMNSCHH